MKKQYALALVGAFGCLTAAASAQAQTTATANLAINASIASTCAVALSQPGTLTGAPGAVLSVSASVNITCSNGAPYTVSLGNGSNADGSSRRLRHSNAALTSNNFIPYTISGTQAADTAPSFPGTGSGTAQATTIWIRAAVPATAAVGTYSDTVTVSVTY